jgi:hypothetical protein
MQAFTIAMENPANIEWSDGKAIMCARAGEF